MADADFPVRVLAALETHCLSRGTFASVNTVEPDQAPGTGVTAAVWFNRLGPPRAGSGLNATSVRLEYGIRLYKPLLSFPQERVDVDLLTACSDLMATLTGDFTLADGIRGIDLLGAYGPGLEAVAGYLEQDGNKYRIITITVPCVVNDVWDQEA